MQAGSFLTLLFANPGQFNVQDDPNRFPCCCFHICNFYHQPKKILLYIFESSRVLFTMMMRWFLRSSTINFVRFHSFQQLLTWTRANGRKDPVYDEASSGRPFLFCPGLATLCSLRVGKSFLDKNGVTSSSNTESKVNFPMLWPVDKHR